MSRRALDRVLWIGGGSGAGKSSVARAISRRYEVELYAADARGYAHLARSIGSDRPAAAPDERWLVPTPEELAERFLVGAAEKFPLSRSQKVSFTFPACRCYLECKELSATYLYQLRLSRSQKVACTSVARPIP